MKLSIQFVVLVFVMCLSIPSFAGGPWLFPKKGGYIQFQTILPVYPYTSLLNGRFIKNTQDINRSVFNSDYSIYLEYGLTDRLNIMTSLPFKYVSTGDLVEEPPFSNVLEEGSLFGLNNYAFALKYGLVDKKVKVAVSLQTTWNTISKNLDKGLATGFDANSFGLMAHIGRSNEKHYGFLEVGFHKYTNGFSDVLEINLEHGFRLGARFNLAFVLNARHSLENGTFVNENLEQTGLYPNNQEWAAVSGKLNYEGKNGLGVNFGMPLIPIKFQYVGFNGTVTLGVYKRF